MTNRRLALGTTRLLAGALVLVCLATACTGGTSTTPTEPAGTPTSSIATQPSTASVRLTGEGGAPTITPASVPQPAFPAVVGLSWLNGMSRESAIRVVDDGIVRWQGARSGEHAELIQGGAYRWVGPDGSMVGCAAPERKAGPGVALRCVAIDAAGNTAVTAAAKGPRIVYGPDGRWLGAFDADGVRLTSRQPTASLRRQIAASGVSMASLVEFATGRQPFAGGVTGDPHVITSGGRRLSTQKTGDFHARLGDPAHRIQLRTEAVPYQPDLSFVTVAAVGVPDHRIEFGRAGQLQIDGVPVRSSEAFQQIPMSGGEQIGLWPKDAAGQVAAVVLWPDGSTVAMTADSALGLTVIASLPRGSAAGLFGSAARGSSFEFGSTRERPTPAIPDPFAGDQAGDLVSRSGALTASVDQVVESWRVRAGESLFSDLPEAPPAPRPPIPIDPAAARAAQKYCAVHSISNGEDLSACIFDVARTGDQGYVAHHFELARAADRRSFPPALAGQWPALMLGAGSSAQTYELGSVIDATVRAGTSRLYRLTLSNPAKVAVKAGECEHDGARVAEQGAAALRLFDDSGQPVSARGAICGVTETETLPTGVYILLLAGPESGPPTPMSVRVVLQ